MSCQDKALGHIAGAYTGKAVDREPDMSGTYANVAGALTKCLDGKDGCPVGQQYTCVITH